jgi:cytochrome c
VAIMPTLSRPFFPRFFLGFALAACALSSCARGALGRGASTEALDSARASAPQGATVFEQECAVCHGKRGQGTAAVPAVMGGGALTKNSDERPAFVTAADVFAYVKREMPLPKNRAGTLSDAEYWSVTDFMLRAHGVDLPDQGLTAENAPRVALP